MMLLHHDHVSYHYSAVILTNHQLMMPTTPILQVQLLLFNPFQTMDISLLMKWVSLLIQLSFHHVNWPIIIWLAFNLLEPMLLILINNSKVMPLTRISVPLQQVLHLDIWHHGHILLSNALISIVIPVIFLITLLTKWNHPCQVYTHVAKMNPIS